MLFASSWEGSCLERPRQIPRLVHRRHDPEFTRLGDKRALPLASGRRRKDAFLDEPLAKVDAVLEIDPQGNDSGSSIRCSAYQHRASPTKMPRPLVTAGIEQRNDLPCPGGQPRQHELFQRTYHAYSVCLGRTVVPPALE